VLALADGLYDAQERSTGESLSPVVSRRPMPNVVVASSSVRIAGLAAALARFHRSTVRFSPEAANRAGPLPARLASLNDGIKARRDALLSTVRLRAEGKELGRAPRWLELLPEIIGAALAACDDLPERSAGRYVLYHGDLWPAHTYFDGDAFASFTDFESLCFASPALDLARVILHFGGWEIREDALQSYGRVAPVAERDQSMLPVEAGAVPAGEGYWPLDALYGEASSRTSPEQRTAHELNPRELAASLEPVATEIERLGR
jgi:hypothetical protein